MRQNRTILTHRKASGRLDSRMYVKYTAKQQGHELALPECYVAILLT